MFNRQLYRWLMDLPNATPLADIHSLAHKYTPPHHNHPISSGATLCVMSISVPF
jgi:hypothetical protein